MAQPIGWEYRYKHLTLNGAAPASAVALPALLGFSFPGVAGVAGSAQTIYTFTSESVVTRVDLTFSVNAAGSYFGAAVLKNPAPVVDVNESHQTLLVTVIGNNNAVNPAMIVVTKTMSLTPWTGIVFHPNETIAIGWLGDGASVVNIGVDLLYLSSPGNTVLP